MGKETVDVLVDGGKATAAPPIGPALSPLKINVANVINEINEKTKSFSGMQVPVKIVVDTDTKEFTITVGIPPVSSMLKKELGVAKLATVGEDKIRKLAGDLSLDVVKKISSAKSDSMYGSEEGKIKQVLGTCLSCGVTVDGKDPREIIKELFSK